MNRPAPCVDLDSVIEGLVHFSKLFSGELWLEILIAKGVNDSDEDIQALLAVVHRMRLSRVQLNTVARPPLEKYALPVSQERLREIATRFSSDPGVPRVDIIAHGISVFEKGREVIVEQSALSGLDREKLLDDILQMLKRRPCTADDINRTFMLGGPEEVEQLLDPLVKSGKVKKRLHGDKLFYQ